MTIRVVKPSDVYTIAHIIGTLYGPPGGLKTSLGFTSDNPLLLDFDEGVHRAAFRRDFVPVAKWEDVADMQAEDVEGYGTIVVDTAGRALDKLSADIIRRNPKMGTSSGALTLQGYGQLGVEFAAWLRKLRAYGHDVLLILHASEEGRGDDTVTRIDAQGKSKQEIYKVSDFMGSVSIDRDGTITINMNPTDTTFGKNPGMLPPVKFKTIGPSSRYMTEVFAQQKAKINAMTEEQRQVSAALEQWREKIMDAEDAAGITKLIAEVPNLDPRIQENAKKVLASIARDRGLVYDKASGAYVTKPAEKPAHDAQGTLPAAAAPSEPAAQPEPATEPPVASGGPSEARQRLDRLFLDAFPNDKERGAAFKAADAQVFWKGKLKGARGSVADLSDIDVQIMLKEIETGALQLR